MKKLMLFIAIIIASGTISTYANGEKVHLKLVFEAVDAQGNRDTAEFAIRDRATNGLDPELGEVNLYGVPPQGDLDIRLVQRKVENKDNIWLNGAFLLPIYGFTNNIDLKKDYRENAIMIPAGSRDFVLKVYAKYYPVDVYILSISNQNSLSTIDIKSGEHIAMTTYDEPLGTSTGWQIDSDNNNFCFYKTNFNLETAEQYKTIINSDTIYNFISNPVLLNCFSRNNSFSDSTSRNMLLGFNCFPSGFGNVEIMDNSIKLYPNPSNNNVIISEGNAGDTFEVVNSAGDKISNFAVEVFPYSYDVSALPAGVYYIINTTSGNGFGKFVKE